MLKSLFQLNIAIVLIATAHADWREASGWVEVQTWASQQGYSLPDTSSIHAGMVEAAQGVGGPYLFNFTSLPFSDISTVNNVSDTNSNFSGHATNVASYYFGNNLSISPDVDAVDVYEANDFFNRLLTLNINLNAEVLSHAYIAGIDSNGNTADPSTVTTYNSRLDELTQSQGTLSLVGTNNGSSNAIPPIWTYSYNTLSVGRSDGNHAAGVVPSGYEGPGRTKPEIVASINATSWTTGALSSITCFLLAEGKAMNSSNAQLPVTLKSILLAGATKEEFSSWDNSQIRPIDERYGAGEANIYHSYRILKAGEQSPGNVGRYGWDHNSSRSLGPSSTRAYTFTIPDYASHASLCVNLSWERDATASYSPLSDFSLVLKNAQGALATSDSAVDNLEHLWLQDLAPGTYTIEVSNKNITATNYTLAWRSDVETESTPANFSIAGGTSTLDFTDLAPLHNYTLQRSTDLNSWNSLNTLQTDSAGELSTSDSPPSNACYFYRLSYFSP